MFVMYCTVLCGVCCCCCVCVRCLNVFVCLFVVYCVVLYGMLSVPFYVCCVLCLCGLCVVECAMVYGVSLLTVCAHVDLK